MDEEPTGVSTEGASTRVSTASRPIDGRESAGRDREEEKEQPAVEISRLRTEIDATRDELGTYVSELDRRRHEALDLRHQAKKHPVLVIGAGVVILGAVAGGVVMAIRARRPDALGRSVQRRLARGAAPPPTGPADPGWMLKVLVKAALSIGAAVVTRLLSQGTIRRPRSA